MARISPIRAVVLALSLTLCAQHHAPVPPPKVFTSFHLRTPALAPRERIYGIEIHAAGAEFVSLVGMPIDWTINIENAGDWQSSLAGSCHHGGSALSDHEISALVFKLQLDATTSPLQISGQVHIVNELNMKERTSPVTGKDLISNDPELLVTAPKFDRGSKLTTNPL